MPGRCGAGSSRGRLANGGAIAYTWAPPRCPRNSLEFSGTPGVGVQANGPAPRSQSKNRTSGSEHMNHLTRRNLLTGAAAASAATALTPLAGSPASAAAPLATAQAPGWYRYNVGSYQITAATDGKRSFKLPDTFVLNAKKDQVNEALLAAHMEKDMMTIPYTPIVINTGIKAHRRGHRRGRSQLRAQQGRRRPVPEQPEGRGHRPRQGRYGHHLALPRRPHQRPDQAGRLAGIPQRRDPGAGGGVEILHG